MTQVAVAALTLAACGGDNAETSAGSTVSDTITGSIVDTMRSRDTAADPPPPSFELLTPEGLGPLRIGMTTAEVVAAAGADANPGAVGGPDPATCDMFRPREAPRGVLVMIEKGVLTRISISRNTAIKTPEGFSIGDAAADVLAAYGSRARVERHEYVEAPAKYITVWDTTGAGGERRGMRYEIDGAGKVAQLHAGGQSIEYVEGCV